MALHKDVPFTNSHFAHAFEYANAAARTSASGFVGSDVGKMARQLDNNSLWLLATTAPTWTGAGLADGIEGTGTGTIAPVDTDTLWLDENTSPATMKYHNGASWVPVQASTSGGGTTEIIAGVAAPGDTAMYWVDTNSSPAIWKYYNGTSWVALQAAGGSGSTEISEGVAAPGDTAMYWVDTNTTPAIWKYHDGTSWVALQAAGGSGGVGIEHMDIRPNDMRLDDTATGSDEGTAWNIISTVDFDNAIDGSVWFSFKFPDSWETTSDIRFTIQYSCDGVDNGQAIYFNTQTWVVDDGNTPIPGSPNNNNYDVITTSAANTNALTDLALTNGKVDLVDLGINTSTIMVKLTRESTHVTDTYGGTFQIMAVQVSQP